MTWNYRVFRQTYKDIHTYHIYEVYYDKNGKPEMWTDDPVEPGGETLKDLASDLKYMAQALKRPVLEIYNFRGNEKLREICESNTRSKKVVKPAACARPGSTAGRNGGSRKKK